MSNVREINPTNLANIPAMLRFWAAELEAGREPMPRTSYLVMVHDGNRPPQVCQFGQELSRMEELGALFTVAMMPVQMDMGPDGG